MYTKMIFPNIAVKNLTKTVDFFTQLGFTFNEKFTDENATCMIINDTASVMLLTETFYLSFTTKRLADTNTTSEVMLAVSFESKEKVDELLTKAISMGATEGRKEDMGFMYSRSFHDLDGHIWEFFWMDENAAN